MLLGLSQGFAPLRQGRQVGPRMTRRSLLAGGLAAAAAGFWPAVQASAASKDDADTSSQSRDEAIRSLPLADLNAETRRKLMAVIERPSIYRRLPEQSIDCDPALFLFLIRNPEVVVSIWQVLGISNMTAQRRGPYEWNGNDAAGTICDVELVYGTDNMHILYGDGFYEGALLKQKITGRCVLLMHSGFAQSRDRRWRIGNRMDVFLQIDNTAADVVARTLSPWVGKVADANFQESCNFAARLSQTAEQNGSSVQRLADRLVKVEPPVRDEFSKVAAGVQERAARRDVGTTVRRR